MLLRDDVLNHERDHLHDALNVSNDMRTRCRERVFFASFSNALQREELFEDEQDAPKELSTVTGDLQRCLKMIDNQLEYEFTLLHFMQYQRLAMDAHGRYKYLYSKDKSKEDKLKLSIINLMEDLKNQEEDGENDGIDDISTNAIIKRISIVKKSNYNFETYMNKFHREFSNNGDFDVDDLLKDIFK